VVAVAVVDQEVLVLHLRLADQEDQVEVDHHLVEQVELLEQEIHLLLVHLKVKMVEVVQVIMLLTELLVVAAEQLL
jgi:hypothetical protein